MVTRCPRAGPRPMRGRFDNAPAGFVPRDVGLRDHEWSQLAMFKKNGCRSRKVHWPGFQRELHLDWAWAQAPVHSGDLRGRTRWRRSFDLDESSLFSLFYIWKYFSIFASCGLSIFSWIFSEVSVGSVLRRKKPDEECRCDSERNEDGVAREAHPGNDVKMGYISVRET